MLYLYLCVFVSGGLIQTLVWNRITRQVNERLPNAERYAVWAWSLRRSNRGEINMYRIWRTHRQLFPDSYLRLWYVTALVLWLLWWLLGGLSMAKA